MDESPTGVLKMLFRQPVALLLALGLVAACAAPAAVEPSPSASHTAAPPASVPVPSRTPAAPAPSPTPSPTPATPSPTPSPTPATPSPTPSPTPSTAAPTTMTVRAYFLLHNPYGEDPALVPVLRTVPKSSATAEAALRALLAGPSEKEKAARPQLLSLVPPGTKLLGVEVAHGLATVDLSSAFASLSPADAWDQGSFELRGRLAQVVYTVTQFPTVDRVNFKLDGKPVRVFSADKIALDKPVTRATYRDRFLPLIFVDGPAWGAALPNPGRVRGLANVFEAQFRVAVLDAKGKVLLDVPAHARCGTGCWGAFDVTLRYDVARAQWGTLRVWLISEFSGRPASVREYPVYLRPAG